jgi:hypothetical protein
MQFVCMGHRLVLRCGVHTAVMKSILIPISLSDAKIVLLHFTSRVGMKIRVVQPWVVELVESLCGFAVNQIRLFQI